MAASVDILEEALGPPVEERARLVLELIRRLDGDRDETAEDAWAAEIERRSAEVDAGTASTMTVDEYRDHVRARRSARRAR